MPKLEYFVIAESVSVDQSTNRISFFNVLEEVHTPKFPVLIPQLVVVAAWNAEEGDLGSDFQSTIIFPLPDGKSKEFSQHFQMTRPRHRTIANLVGLSFENPGIVKFKIQLNGKHAASHTIDIHKVEA